MDLSKIPQVIPDNLHTLEISNLVLDATVVDYIKQFKNLKLLSLINITPSDSGTSYYVEIKGIVEALNQLKVIQLPWHTTFESKSSRVIKQIFHLNEDITLIFLVQNANKSQGKDLLHIHAADLNKSHVLRFIQSDEINTEVYELKRREDQASAAPSAPSLSLVTGPVLGSEVVPSPTAPTAPRKRRASQLWNKAKEQLKNIRSNN